jgi:hypothetical protein
MNKEAVIKKREREIDAFLVSIDRNGGKSKEEETWICELERISIIGTDTTMYETDTDRDI